MDRRSWLIAAIMAGFIAGNAAQFAHWIGHESGIAWLEWRRPEGEIRFSGWWDPAVGGSLLVGALGLHLPLALMGRARLRIIGVAGAAVTLLGILATGTRGAWLAAGALLVFVAAVAIVRRVRARAAPVRPRSILIGVVVVAIIGAAAWLTVGDAIARRAAETRDEIGAAFKGDYSSYTGQRVLMARWAVQAVRAAPLHGLGAGGYGAWAEERARADEFEVRADWRYPHAHNALLHIAATSGLIGLLIAGAVVVVALRGSFHRDQLAPGGMGSVQAGPAFALCGLLLVSAFDTVHVNAQTAAMLMTLCALSLLPRPAPPPSRDTGPGPAIQQ